MKLRTVLGPRWGHTGISPGEYWDWTGEYWDEHEGCTGIRLGPHWDQTGAAVGPDWEQNGTKLGRTQKSDCSCPGTILGGPNRVILGRWGILGAEGDRTGKDGAALG